MIPVIAGISYEILRLAGRYDNPFVSIISAPGLWIQRITTKEPDKYMVQVAIASVEAVFDWKAYLKDNYNYEVTEEMMSEDEEEDHIKINYKEERDDFLALKNPDNVILEDDDWEDGPDLDEPDEDDWEE
jgi:hypothetical protein